MAASAVPANLQEKIDRFKSYNPTPDDPALTPSAKQAVELAIQKFMPAIEELQKKLSNTNRKARRQEATIKDLEQQIHNLQPKTKTYPKDFKPSQNLKKMQEQLADLQAEVAKNQKAELAEFERAKLEEISQRLTKSIAASNYAKALQSSYASAMEAITNRKKEVQANGEIISYGAGVEVKALIDLQDKTLFSFEALPTPTIDYRGSVYQLHSGKSLVHGGSAGYEYQIRFLENLPPLFARN